LNRVGFDGIKWGKQVDVFSGSKHESSAANFDTFGVTFAGVKKQRETTPQLAGEQLQCSTAAKPFLR
jgi:hypothetical protein